MIWPSPVASVSEQLLPTILSPVRDVFCSINWPPTYGGTNPGRMLSCEYCQAPHSWALPARSKTPKLSTTMCGGIQAVIVRSLTCQLRPLHKLERSLRLAVSPVAMALWLLLKRETGLGVSVTGSAFPRRELRCTRVTAFPLCSCFFLSKKWKPLVRLGTKGVELPFSDTWEMADNLPGKLLILAW